jgi:hypothetical protein
MILNEILNEKTKNKVYCKECKKYFFREAGTERGIWRHKK